jgi:hypothetical protein
MHTSAEKLLEAVSSNSSASKLRSSCMIPGVMRQKNMVMSPVGSGTKTDCAGEGQQQFTSTEPNQVEAIEELLRTGAIQHRIRENPSYWRPLPSNGYVKTWQSGKTWKVL